MTSSLQYVTTSDGYNIAYSVTGTGPPFLLSPCLLQSDILREPRNLAHFANAVAQRFSLVRYDGRGTGNSSRGLPDQVDLRDTIEDALAVVRQLDLHDFVLYGDVFSSYTTLLTASALADRVKMVVLVNPVPLNGNEFLPTWSAMYKESWEMFTNAFVATFGMSQINGATFRTRVNHRDFIRLAHSAVGHHLHEVIGTTKVPTLVLAVTEPPNPNLTSTAREIASAIPNSRVVFFDGTTNGAILAGPDGQGSPGLDAIEDFLRELPEHGIKDAYGGLEPVKHKLSAREAEVLCLIASGHSNQEIAARLVISPSTVAKHVTSILAKTDSRNRAEAAVFAHKRGLA